MIIMGLNNFSREKKSGTTTSMKNKSVKTNSKEVQHSFTIRHDVSTKVLLDRIQRLKDLTTLAAKLSQGAIVREALELLAKEMEYGKLERKYADFLAHISEDSVLSS
jgi:glutamate synthase domain-containing protein 2